MKEPNCFNCEYCVLNKENNYICNWKHCNMGKKPYYEIYIPKDRIYYLGFKVCNHIFKKNRTKNLMEI